MCRRSSHSNATVPCRAVLWRTRVRSHCDAATRRDAREPCGCAMRRSLSLSTHADADATLSVTLLRRCGGAILVLESLWLVCSSLLQYIIRWLSGTRPEALRCGTAALVHTYRAHRTACCRQCRMHCTCRSVAEPSDHSGAMQPRAVLWRTPRIPSTDSHALWIAPTR